MRRWWQEKKAVEQDWFPAKHIDHASFAVAPFLSLFLFLFVSLSLSLYTRTALANDDVQDTSDGKER